MNRNDLPKPRLQFEWFKKDCSWDERECVYSIVIPLREHDIRREDENCNKVRDEWQVEIGKTKVSGGNGNPPICEGKVDTPFRDGAHARWDSKALGELPIFSICEDTVTKLDNE